MSPSQQSRSRAHRLRNPANRCEGCASHPDKVGHHFNDPCAAITESTELTELTELCDSVVCGSEKGVIPLSLTVSILAGSDYFSD